MDRLNVILPCAGAGSLLGLPYPKELHVVQEGKSLLELSLERCLQAGSVVGRVTIVTRAAKPELLNLLERWHQRLPIALCLFDDRNHEWPGSVLSAEHLFMERNVVLLPDGHLVEHPELRVLSTMQRRLDSNDVVFAYAEEQSERLGALGALHVVGNEVSAFCDKPTTGLDRYNAFWASFGFRGDRGRELLELMTLSVGREPVTLESFRTSGFPIQSYVDLGTWPSLRAFQEQQLAARAPQLVA